MPNSLTTWVAEELGLIALAETEDGLRRVGVLALAPAETRPTTLEEAVVRELGGTMSVPEREALRALILDARRGHQRAVRLHDRSGQVWRILGMPLAEEYAQIILAPAAQAASAELQRRAGLADMAAAVSHEVSNALGAISGWADLARGAPEDAALQANALQHVARCASVAQGIAQQLLERVRGNGKDAIEQVDLAGLVREVVDLLQLQARTARVTIRLETPSSARVRGVRAELFSATWNLAKNAIEACSEGDRVSVAITTDHDNVCLSVSDTGHGMDAATQAQVFTPYFTTKQAGTGIGLALVERAASNAGGEAELHSTPGEGTRFVLRLPRHISHSDTYPHASAPPDATAEETDSKPLAGRSVLIVDDDEALRDMVATALELRGAEVTAVGSRDAATSLEGPYSIALIDMMLQDCRGDDLLAELRSQGAVGLAMLVSGVVQRPPLKEDGEPDDWVRKPFEIANLVERIQRALSDCERRSRATGEAHPS